MPAVKLNTRRLLLRPISIQDCPSIQKHFNNWNIIKYIGAAVPWPYPADGAQRYVEEILKKAEISDTHLWGIELKDAGGEIIGAIEYRLDDYEDDNRGFWLGEPFWGRGIMTEAVIATQNYVFNELNVERLIVKNAESNEGSRVIKIRCGAEKIDRVPGRYLSGDEWEEVWQVRRERWKLMQNATSVTKFQNNQD